MLSSLLMNGKRTACAAARSARALRSAGKERPEDDAERPASGRKRKNPRPSANGHANGVNGNAGGLSGHASGVNGHANGFATVKSMTVHGTPADSQGVAAALPAFAKAIQGFLLQVRRLPLGKAKPQAGLPERFSSGWELRHVSTGRLRFHHERLYRRRELCQAIERELMSVLGIDNYKTSASTGTVLILYNRKELNDRQIVEILDIGVGASRST